MFFAFLPILNLLAIFVLLSNVRPEWPVIQRLTRSVLLVGFVAVLFVELLSLFDGITQTSLILGWSIVLLGLVWASARTHRRDTYSNLLGSLRIETEFERWVLFAIVMILLVTGLVALVAPPQTWDVLNYHLSRVAHWAQNQSVNHYATGIEVQNSIPPGAEYSLLHVYILGQGDRYVHFVQWFAMLGSLLGVAEIARRLGASRKGVFLSVLLSASMPLGIVQASSAMSEYVLSLWVVLAVLEVLELGHDPRSPATWFFLSAAAGLAILTKPLAYAYLLPFATYALFILLSDRSLKHAVAAVLVSLFIVAVINLPSALRSVHTYGSPFAEDQVSRHSNEEISVRTLVSNTLRNAALHAGTPSPHINKGIYLAIERIHLWLGLDINEPSMSSFGSFKVFKPITNEVTISNPFHAWLMLAVLGYVAIKHRSMPGTLRILILLSLTSYALMSVVFRWLIFGGRFQLPFFLLMMPIMGYALCRALPAKGLWLLSVLLPAFAWPWLFSIQTRPIIPTSHSTVGSIFSTERKRLYFANGPYLEQPYLEMTSMVLDTGCDSVGISLPGGAAEYPLWFLLGAPQSDFRIEWIVSDTPSEIYIRPEFDACAVICDSCPEDWETYRGLPIVYQQGPFKLYGIDELVE